MGTDFMKCNNIIKQINRYPRYWTMERAVYLLDLVDKDKYLDGDNIEKIKMGSHDYNDFLNANVNPELCKEELNNEFERVSLALQDYIKLWKSYQRSNVKRFTECTCAQVIEIQKYYNKR